MADPTDRPAGPTDQADPPPVALEPRQRWRLTYARDPIDSDQAGRVVFEGWQRCLAASGLPLAGLDPGGGGRARIAFAAPLPAVVRGAAELADLWLVDRVPRWVVREALQDRLPAAHRWIGVEDVWLGSPALASRVVAADWQITLAPVAASSDDLAAAARQLIAAPTLPRVRRKGTTEKRYDLRPLLATVAVLPGEAEHAVRVRTRFDAELGTGRPDEVLAALGAAIGRALTATSIVRERLILADDEVAEG